MIKIPIEIGDTVYVGRFKNKKIIVKSITYNEYGLPLINGRPLLTLRIEKLMKKESKENIVRNIIREEISTILKEDDQFSNVKEVFRKKLIINNKTIFNIIGVLVPRKTGFTPYILSTKETGLATGQSGFAPFGTSRTEKSILWKGTPSNEMLATTELNKALKSISIK